MSLLFVNACMREGSRTERVARRWLNDYQGEVVELALGTLQLRPLNPARLEMYNNAVAAKDYADEMFDYARQFAKADEVLIAAPCWNYSIPAQLHAYLELVCSQGVTFDIDEKGAYVTLCRARKLTFITTAGGLMPRQVDDHAFGYVRTLATEFWHIPHIECRYVEGLDAPNVDADALLENPHIS